MAHLAHRTRATWPERKLGEAGQALGEGGLPAEVSDDVESVEGLRRRRKGAERR